MTTRKRFRWLAAGLLAALLLPLLALAGPGVISPAGAQTGGAIVLMGIDAEDGGPGGHGPIANYEQIVEAVNAAVVNGQTGVAVMGGGVGTNVNAFWDLISTDTGIPVTYFDDAAAIAGADFNNFAIVAVSSSEFETPSGGLTDAENDELTLRGFDVVDFVNAGGGLIGFSGAGLTTPFGYMGDFGAFSSNSGLSYDLIAPTAEGEAIGVTDALDICCWHDTFVTYPSFLQVLALNDDDSSEEFGEVAALGGFDIAIPTGCTLEPEALSIAVGDTYTATATATEEGSPSVGTPVVFEVLTGPHAGTTGNATTDAGGQAQFSYAGTTVGTDEVTAAFTDSLGRVRNCNIVTVEWVAAPPAPVTPAAPAATAVAVRPTFTG
jgi:hypothetical protein